MASQPFAYCAQHPGLNVITAAESVLAK